MTGDPHSLLRTHFGFSDFRPGQLSAIGSLLARRHALVVMPTGAGKSMVYQLAALLAGGTTLVVSPLISLMQDQVAGLKRRGIEAAFINSSLSASAQDSTLRRFVEDRLKILYVAPERLRAEAFQKALARVKISLLAVDEAHCVSSWGHDFRPDYLYIAAVRKQMSDPLTVALTATATPQVQEEILNLLGLRGAERIVTGFNRPNLGLHTQYAACDADKLPALQKSLDGQKSGAAIVYTGTRRDADEIAGFIQETLRRPAMSYHAGMDTEERARVQDRFMAGELQTVVATNAFGMGIDRADVRVVVHFAMPGSLEAYYQEAGRAGRDGDLAAAILLYSPRDRGLQEWFIDNDSLVPDDLKAVYDALVSSGREVSLSLEALAGAAGLPDNQVRIALGLLEEAGSIERLGDRAGEMLIRTGEWEEKVMRETGRKLQERRQRRLAQLERMVNYAEATTCRRQILLKHFGDPARPEARVCCDNCLTSRKAAQKATEAIGDYASLPPQSRTALVILDSVRRLTRQVGVGRLDEVLRGSKARAMAQFGYEKHPYFGRLAAYRSDEVQGFIKQLVTARYLKTAGGSRPVLNLTERGLEAIRLRSPVPLEMARIVSRKPSGRSPQHAPNTIEETALLFWDGLRPEEIAERRGLTTSTIYVHLSRLIEDGNLSPEMFLPPELVRQIQDAAIETASTQPAIIKAALSSDVSYGAIHCVIAQIRREKMDAPTQNGQSMDRDSVSPSQETGLQRIVRLGEEGRLEAVPELIKALGSPQASIRRLAASALGKLEARQAVLPLTETALHDPCLQARQYAVVALGKIGDSSVRQALQTILAEEDVPDYLHVAARCAIDKLSREAVVS